MVGWHHRLNGHEFEQILGDSEGQGSLVCWQEEETLVGGRRGRLTRAGAVVHGVVKSWT